MLLELPEKHQLHKSENPHDIQGRPDTEPCSGREADGLRGNTSSSGRFLPVVKNLFFTKEWQAHPIPRARAASRRSSFGRCLPKKGYKMQLAGSSSSTRTTGDTTWSQPHGVCPAFSVKQLQSNSSQRKGPKLRSQRNRSQKVALQLSYTEIKTVSTQDWRSGSLINIVLRLKSFHNTDYSEVSINKQFKYIGYI